MGKPQRWPGLRSGVGRERITGPTGAVALAVAAGAAVVVARYGPDGSLSLIEGPFPTAVIGLAAVGVVVGVAGRPGRWWATWGLGIASTAAAVVAFMWWWVGATGLVDQHYPPSFLVWVWGALVAVGVAGTGWWSGGAAVRVVRVVAVPFAVFGSFILINSHYGYWPTMGALLQRPVVGQVSRRGLALALSGQDLGALGRFGPVSITGPPGFDGGPAWVWLPPAFNRVRHADLPVLLMLPGVPGKATNWDVAGEVVPLADAWARTHGGIAPVMVFVSGNGAADRDTECVNGTQGPAETYLSRSVPDFITHRLGITAGAARWGVVGFSEGGTCALGLALEHPHLYGRFVDLSGELAPTWGPNSRTTLNDLYAGNAAAMLHHEPLWLLSHRRYPDTEGWLAGSAEDRHDERIARRLADAADAAGMVTADVSGLPGGHSWSFARVTFDRIYPDLVASMPTPTGHGREPVHRRHLLVADPRHAPGIAATRREPPPVVSRRPS